jgi:hypothetical protein
MQITAEDILSGRITAAHLVESSASSLANIVEKLSEHSKSNNWTPDEVAAVAQFAEDLGGEFLIQIFTGVQKSSNMKNMIPLNKAVGMRVVELVNAARATQK